MKMCEEQLDVILEMVSNHEQYLEDYNSDDPTRALNEFIAVITGRIIVLREMMVEDNKLLSINPLRLLQLEKIEKYYNHMKEFDNLMDEHIALIEGSKEYTLLKDLPFLNAGIVFHEYRSDPTCQEFCVYGKDKECARIFNDNENSTLRSILHIPEWILKQSSAPSAVSSGALFNSTEEELNNAYSLAKHIKNDAIAIEKAEGV